ncbi:MAG: hypothetical protein ACTSUG_06080 [Candidatus Helarchaeota archaeon]
MENIIEALNVIAISEKIDLQYQDYISIILMIIGTSIALIFVGLIISGFLTSGSGESSIIPAWRR